MKTLEGPKSPDSLHTMHSHCIIELDASTSCTRPDLQALARYDGTMDIDYDLEFVPEQVPVVGRPRVPPRAREG